MRGAKVPMHRCRWRTAHTRGCAARLQSCPGCTGCSAVHLLLCSPILRDTCRTKAAAMEAPASLHPEYPSRLDNGGDHTASYRQYYWPGLC